MRHGLAIGVLIAATLTWRTIAAQPPPAFSADYTVEVKDTAAHLFHVTATFRNVDQPRLQLSLPIWTPGWYTLEYYARNVRLFTVSDGAGRRLAAPLSRAQTWDVDTRGANTVTAEFDYFANVLAVNQAKITNQYAFFTGTQLFLEPVGHRDTPATVRFVVPRGWGIATALVDTGSSTVYTAPDYDALVDAPTWLGDFDLYRFDVDGKPVILVQKSVAPIPAAAVAQAAARFASMIRAERAVFGSLPYGKYLVFSLPGTAESSADGALEHGNSYVAVTGPLTDLPWPNAHEFFHLWNVKRIRPAEFWPYDYSRPVDTPSLWVSEGITDYYAEKTAYRAGFSTENDLLAVLAQAIELYERQPERKFVSPSDASRSTWRAYLHEPISYYVGGEIMGALLDLSILRDTQGRRGLDEVMRELYKRFYQHERGFTPEDLIRTINAVAGRDYSDFFRRYVDGVEVPPYDSILRSAGYRMTDHGEAAAYLGMASSVTPEGRRVDVVGGTSMPAGMAGLRAGDMLLAVDGVPIDRVRFVYPNGSALAIQPDRNLRVMFTILRDTTRLDVPIVVRRGPPAMRIEEDSAATADQIAVRRAWLARQ